MPHDDCHLYPGTHTEADHAQPATPTLDRLSAEDGRRRAALDFIEWLNEQGMHIAVWWTPTIEALDAFGQPVTRKMARELTYAHERPDNLVMRWLGLDPADVERERRALLAAVQS